MLQRFLTAVLLTAACAAQLRAQAPTPQIVTQEQLTVRVVFENETAASDVRVELLNIYGSGVDSRATDISGTVRFTELTPATYKVRISGFDIATTESGAIDLTDSGPSVTQLFHVRREIPATEMPPLAPLDATIPPEARNEFAKATEKMEQKNWADAKPHLDRAISIYPKYAAAYNNLAVVYLNLKDGEKAVESFRTAAQLDETLQQANLYLGQFYYENRDYPQAEPYLLRAANAEPRNPQVLTALANAELRNGEPEQALINAQKVHSLPEADRKKFAIAHLVAAQVLTDRGDNARAQEEYRQYLQEAPDSPIAPRVKDALAKLNTASR